LDANKIPYQDLNVAEDKALAKEMITRSGQRSVPVIDVDGELMIGFDEAQLKQKLGL
jgi:glutaredoxin